MNVSFFKLKCFFWFIICENIYSRNAQQMELLLLSSFHFLLLVVAYRWRIPAYFLSLHSQIHATSTPPDKSVDIHHLRPITGLAFKTQPTHWSVWKHPPNLMIFPILANFSTPNIEANSYSTNYQKFSR